MTPIKVMLAAVVGIVSLAGHAPAIGQALTGDTKLACEAILCLSTGQRPDECTPPIRRYFSISYRRISDTLRGRTHFLNLCPKGNDAQMTALVRGIVYGAGACDADTLNATLLSSPDDSGLETISNVMPDYCVAYYTHPYTNFAAALPVYAGDRWVEPGNYAAAMADYTARTAAAAAGSDNAD